MINIGFMGIRVGFRFYEYLMYWRDPYLLDLSFGFFMIFYLCSGLWTCVLVYSNYVFFWIDAPKDERIVTAMWMLVIFGYLIMIEGAAFMFLMIGFCISVVFYLTQNTRHQALEDVFFIIENDNRIC